MSMPRVALNAFCDTSPMFPLLLRGDSPLWVALLFMCIRRLTACTFFRERMSSIFKLYFSRLRPKNWLNSKYWTQDTWCASTRTWFSPSFRKQGAFCWLYYYSIRSESIIASVVINTETRPLLVSLASVVFLALSSVPSILGSVAMWGSYRERFFSLTLSQLQPDCSSVSQIAPSQLTASQSVQVSWLIKVLLGSVVLSLQCAPLEMLPPLEVMLNTEDENSEFNAETGPLNGSLFPSKTEEIGHQEMFLRERSILSQLQTQSLPQDSITPQRPCIPRESRKIAILSPVMESPDRQLTVESKGNQFGNVIHDSGNVVAISQNLPSEMGNLYINSVKDEKVPALAKCDGRR